MLSKLRSYRPSHATVVAYLALFVALGGSSYAALKVTSRNVPRDALTGADIKNLTGRDVRNNSLTGADVKSLTSGDVTDSSLLAQDFAPGQLPKSDKGETGEKGDKGDKGEQGDEGDPGQPGGTGLPGSPAASALTGHTANTAIGASQTTYASPNGTSAQGGGEFTVSHVSPNSTIVARDLFVRTALSSSGATGTATATFTLRDDFVGTGVSCSVSFQNPFPGAVETTCNSGASTHTISPGSEISLQITTGASTTVQFVRFGWRATTP